MFPLQLSSSSNEIVILFVQSVQEHGMEETANILELWYDNQLTKNELSGDTFASTAD